MTLTSSSANACPRTKPRLWAYYLPQFHPIPENDAWWGPGFTEWTNTAKARPRFRGHYQPRIPADLGYYDLRLAETRSAQAQLARQAGIEAFCYYHYWFGDKQLLERPFNEVLQSGEPDFPFLLCWANETWTGVWHGSPRRILIEQKYGGLADYRRHFEYLLPAFRDRRYIRVNDKPVFVIYKPESLPIEESPLPCWQLWAKEAGLPGLYFVAVTWNQVTPLPPGFDAQVVQCMPPRQAWFPWSQPVRKIRRYIERRLGQPTRYDYSAISPNLLPASLPRHAFPCALPNWDNSPRSGADGLTFHESTPQLFQSHLRAAMELVRSHPEEEQIVFIKSWNEWAEGNHLEPDLRFGHDYLDAVRVEVARFGERRG